ncbi:MAG: hypothetical protein CL867_11425 [Cytophagaceae bacterium]|nr:hypothetical protein [Cytophagaceae bacterium]
MAQELKPINNSFFGGRRSWRDEARLRLQQALGETGERLGEGFLGESEEEKYLEFLQRTYGSELPRDEEGNIDVPLSRPMGDALRNMSDIGAADIILMMLSGSGSVMPKAASIAAGTETAALLGDAQGEFRKDNLLGGGIMAATAGLPFGINRLLKEGSRNKTKNTPLLPDPSRRQFLKAMGLGIGTLAVVSSPLGALLRNTGKVMGKIDPTKFLRKQKPMYDAIAGDKELLQTTDFANMPDEFLADTGFNLPKITKTNDGSFEINANYGKDFENYVEGNKIQNKIQMDFFEENGLTKNDLLNIEEDGGSYLLSDMEIESHFDLNSRNADPGSIKVYRILSDGKDTGDYVETFKIDGVPVADYGSSSSMGHYQLITIPKKEALLKLAQ